MSITSLYLTKFYIDILFRLLIIFTNRYFIIIFYQGQIKNNKIIYNNILLIIFF